MPDQAPCGCGCANVFSTRDAKDDLKRYQDHGPDPTTRALIAAITREGVEGATLLDIGGGIGAIQLELLAAGAARSEGVDASPPYIRLARTEANRRGLADRAVGRVGDFVAVAAEVEPADIVTLDRVVCCYSDPAALVGRAADHAVRLVGLVYPRTNWWIRLGARIANITLRFRRGGSRIYVHPDRAVEAPLRTAGFERRTIKRTLIWQVALFVRRPGSAAA
jgi:predicted TPR repeat methyltransferase